MVSVCFRCLESSSFAEFVRAYKDFIPREGFSNHKGGMSRVDRYANENPWCWRNGRWFLSYPPPPPCWLYERKRLLEREERGRKRISDRVVRQAG